MYYPKATLATLFAALALASATPFVGIRQNGVTCQTSSGSPATADVTNTINELKGRGGNCANSNGEASDCTTVVTQDSGAIGVCGEKDDESSTLTCEQVADYATQVQTTCLKNGKAGGTFTVSASKRIIVFNSKDS
ncbi:hypothetical protein F5Y19DRAFT_376967 [Xylariaceae sp. FL1651]|nr:hypothetical protein F5Y19DRAFT_376967 [Xylariaceae sp. FL1651]